MLEASTKQKLYLCQDQFEINSFILVKGTYEARISIFIVFATRTIIFETSIIK